MLQSVPTGRLGALATAAALMAVAVRVAYLMAEVHGECLSGLPSCA